MQKVTGVLIILGLFFWGCTNYQHKLMECEAALDRQQTRIGTMETEIGEYQHAIKVRDTAFEKANVMIMALQVESADIFDLYERCLTDKRNASKRHDIELENIHKDINVLNQRHDAEVNTLDSFYVILEGQYEDSQLYLQRARDSLVECVKIFKFMDQYYVIIRKDSILENQSLANIQLGIQEKLYKACKEGRFENISECTCNDILGEVKFIRGRKSVLDRLQ